MKKEHKRKKSRRRSPVSEPKQQYPADWVPIQLPPNLEEMFEHWIDSDEPNVGWCLLCDCPIPSADDLIPGTNSHNCEAGRELDGKIRAAEAAEQHRKSPAHAANRQSGSDSSARSSAPEPQVGIFWFHGKLIMDTTPLSEAESCGDSRTHPRGHIDYWAELQAVGSVPAEVEYDEIPRGRVAYDTVHDRFNVFRDRCLPARAVREVISRMHLPKDKTTVLRDPHYRCPRCISASD